MMISNDELRALAGHREEGPHVSLFMPTARTGVEIQQGPIRFKNLISEVESQLKEQEKKKPEIEALLNPAQQRLQDDDFWQHQSDGLAFFLARGFAQSFCLAERFEELAVVEHRFHLKPLFPLISGDGAFYLLALSQNQVRLFQGSRDHISEVILGEEVPRSLADALGHDLTEEHLQLHTGGGDVSSPIYHAQGAGKDDVKPELRKFLSLVDEGLKKSLGHTGAPLVLAGVDYLLPIYRAVSGYPEVLEEGIIGNPETRGGEALHEQAWQLVGPRFHARRSEARERFYAMASREKSSKRLTEVLLAAVDGRIETLFVASGVRQWGTFDSEKRVIDLHDAAHPNDEDLLDLAAVQTYLNGGTVYVVKPGEVPGGDLSAAVLRY
ncbi:MAG: baeRF3 domain-containing protein [Gammaproteobacteria bacterium]